MVCLLDSTCTSAGGVQKEQTTTKFSPWHQQIDVTACGVAVGRGESSTLLLLRYICPSVVNDMLHHAC